MSECLETHENRWPWALIEGALDAGWSPNTSDTLDYHWDELMHILTGEEVVLTNTTEMSSDDLCQHWSLIISPSR